MAVWGGAGGRRGLDHAPARDRPFRVPRAGWTRRGDEREQRHGRRAEVGHQGAPPGGVGGVGSLSVVFSTWFVDTAAI